MPVDFMAVLQAGQGLVPDLREQLWQDRQRNEVLQAKRIETQNLQAAQVRKQQFQTDISAAVQSGDPRAIGLLMAKYPEFADQVKPGWQALSEDARRANLTQTGMVYERARNGDTKGAAALLRKRYEADVAAGQGDETTKEILDALEGDDPQAQKVAIGSLGFLIAADDPSKFAETYGKLNPTDAKSAFAKEYNDRVGLFGKAAADQWAATQDEKFIPVQAGGSVFRASDLMQPTQTAKGGDQSTGMGGVPAPALGANGMPSVLTSQQYQAIVDVKGKAATDEWAARNGVTVQSAPIRVRSVQEARKLPSGTTFITPDGRTMRKP